MGTIYSLILCINIEESPIDSFQMQGEVFIKFENQAVEICEFNA